MKKMTRVDPQTSIIGNYVPEEEVDKLLKLLASTGCKVYVNLEHAKSILKEHSQLALTKLVDCEIVEPVTDDAREYLEGLKR